MILLSSFWFGVLALMAGILIGINLCLFILARKKMLYSTAHAEIGLLRDQVAYFQEVASRCRAEVTEAHERMSDVLTAIAKNVQSK